MAKVDIYLFLVDVSHLVSHERWPPVYLIRGASLCCLALCGLERLCLTGLARCLQSLSRRRSLTLEPIIEKHEHCLLVDNFLIAQL